MRVELEVVRVALLAGLSVDVDQLEWRAEPSRRYRVRNTVCTCGSPNRLLELSQPLQQKRADAVGVAGYGNPDVAVALAKLEAGLAGTLGVGGLDLERGGGDLEQVGGDQPHNGQRIVQRRHRLLERLQIELEHLGAGVAARAV